MTGNRGTSTDTVRVFAPDHPAGDSGRAALPPCRALQAHAAQMQDVTHQEQIVDMFAGEEINVSEHRAALHTALRAPRGTVIRLEGENVVPKVPQVLDRMAAFDLTVRHRHRAGQIGKPIQAVVNKQIALENTVLFGSVNAGRHPYQQPTDALATADLAWLTRLITRRVPMTGFAGALHTNDEDVKVVVDLRAGMTPPADVTFRTGT